jgi:hypothetical protein
VERIWCLCNIKRVEDEKHFLLKCPLYTQVISQFQNICCNNHLPNLSLISIFNKIIIEIYKYGMRDFATRSPQSNVSISREVGYKLRKDICLQHQCKSLFVQHNTTIAKEEHLGRKENGELYCRPGYQMQR